MTDEDLKRLFAAARQQPPDTSATEYAFETRLLARLRAERAQPSTQPWLSVALRLLPVFAAIVLALGVWNLISARSGLEETLGEPVDTGLLVTVLAGEQP